MTATTHPPVVRELTADDIPWNVAPVARPTSSGAVLALAVELLPTLQDATDADLIETLALTLIDRDAALRAVRDVLSAALEQSHALTVDRDRLRAQHHQLIDEYRTLRVQILRQSEAA